MSKAGKAQAVRLAERFQRVDVDRVVASDLSRAKETAEAIGAAVGRPVEQDADLREMAYGAFQGQILSDLVQSADPGYIACLTNPDQAAPQGESFAEMAARVRRAMDRLAAGSRPQRIVVVTHGGPIRALVLWAMGRPLSERHSVAVGNASVTTLEGSGTNLRVVRANDLNHLAVFKGGLSH